MSIALPVRVLPFGIGTFTPPLPPFYPMDCRCVDLGVCLPLSIRLSKGYSLPIRSNRISWKLNTIPCFYSLDEVPYLLGQMGLVGNGKVISRFSKRQNHPYLLGQIGLVGNLFLLLLARKDYLDPYLLGQIGLVGNPMITNKPRHEIPPLTY